MRIEQLKDFIQIAESSSLSAAAKKLFVTPQALSASLGKMENEVGAKLLVRGQFGIELTKEGDIFLDTAQKIIRIYEAGLSEIHARPACRSSWCTGCLCQSGLAFHRPAALASNI